MKSYLGKGWKELGLPGLLGSATWKTISAQKSGRSTDTVGQEVLRLCISLVTIPEIFL